MDFRNQVLTAAAVAKVDADALLVVVIGGKVPPGLSRPLAAALDAAVRQGDMALKPGRTLYAGKLAGVRAPRVMFAAAADASPRAVKVAMAASLLALKALGSTGRHSCGCLVAVGMSRTTRSPETRVSATSTPVSVA